ncbi:hypothetical protein QTP86_013110 [Hemibagrus guttatus]|nr:hypothetical protein QTP86_013110 [Hemibagrus guttatus]
MSKPQPLDSFLSIPLMAGAMCIISSLGRSKPDTHRCRF